MTSWAVDLEAPLGPVASDARLCSVGRAALSHGQAALSQKSSEGGRSLPPHSLKATGIGSLFSAGEPAHSVK
eukprot:6183244-Pleurochrysis_carterae.AAC.3